MVRSNWDRSLLEEALDGFSKGVRTSYLQPIGPVRYFTRWPDQIDLGEPIFDPNMLWRDIDPRATKCSIENRFRPFETDVKFSVHRLDYMDLRDALQKYITHIEEEDEELWFTLYCGIEGFLEKNPIIVFSAVYSGQGCALGSDPWYDQQVINIEEFWRQSDIPFRSARDGDFHNLDIEALARDILEWIRKEYGIGKYHVPELWEENLETKARRWERKKTTSIKRKEVWLRGKGKEKYDTGHFTFDDGDKPNSDYKRRYQDTKKERRTGKLRSPKSSLHGISDGTNRFVEDAAVKYVYSLRFGISDSVDQLLTDFDEEGIDLNPDSVGALERFVNNPKNTWVRPHTWGRHYRKRHSRGQVQTPKLVFDNDKGGFTKSHQGYKKKELNSSEIFITSPGSLYRACAYISDKRAKVQSFNVPNPEIQEPLSIILRYIQSRADRNLVVDVAEVLRLENEVVNHRLSKWEQRTGKKIISVNHLMGGVFGNLEDVRYGLGDMDGNGSYHVLPITSGGKVYVSKGYYRDSSRYVTNRQELLAGVRRVLAGDMGVNDFNILDRRSFEVLLFTQRLRDCYGGNVPSDIKPRDIVSLRDVTLPNGFNLRRELERHGVLKEDYSMLRF